MMRKKDAALLNHRHASRVRRQPEQKLIQGDQVQPFLSMLTKISPVESQTNDVKTLLSSAMNDAAAVIRIDDKHCQI